MPTSIFGDDTAYAVLLLGALFVHACYQLSVSVLTHLSAHTLSRSAGIRRLALLGNSYTLGAVTMTTLVLLALVNLPGLAMQTDASHPGKFLTLLIIGIAPLIGLVTIIWYYRRANGTQLWLPRPIAAFLLERSRRTKRAFEAFLLGAGTVIGELPFIVAPLLIIALVIGTQPASTWLGWSGAYALLAALPLFVVSAYLTSGHSVARIQHWREQNKTFLQWTSGLALILLTLYLTVLQLGVAA